MKTNPFGLCLVVLCLGVALAVAAVGAAGGQERIDFSVIEKIRADMRREAIKYNLEKSRAARSLSGFGVTRLLMKTRAARRLSRAPVVRRLGKKPAVRRFGEWWAARRLDEVSTGRVVQWCLAWSVSAVVATVSVQVGLLPLMVAHFRRFSLISPLANVVEGPLMLAVMIAGGA